MNPVEVQNKIREIAARIAQKFHPRKIILFGSWARGNPTPDSDVDLLIVADTDNPRKLAREIDGHIFPRRFPLDVLVYPTQGLARRVAIGDFFVNEMLAQGKVLYES